MTPASTPDTASFLIGFDLSSLVTTNLGPASYLFHRCRLSLTVTRDRSFILDPTPDPPASYLREGHPDRAADTDAGRPLELFGVGYRNGFTAESFTEDAPFGNAAMGQRNAFAAGYDTHGTLVDVGNNVGKTNATFQPFHAAPFAVGTSSTVAPGDPVPSGTVIDFDLNLDAPWWSNTSSRPATPDASGSCSPAYKPPASAPNLHGPNSIPATACSGIPPDWPSPERPCSKPTPTGMACPTTGNGTSPGPLAHGPADDTDGDGLPASAEWEAGTDPHNPAEVPAGIPPPRPQHRQPAPPLPVCAQPTLHPRRLHQPPHLGIPAPRPDRP
jgi:hypothetical protein